MGHQDAASAHIHWRARSVRRRHAARGTRQRRGGQQPALAARLRRAVIDRVAHRPVPTPVLGHERQLNHRYERHPRNYLAFLSLATALCCYKRLARLTT